MKNLKQGEIDNMLKELEAVNNARCKTPCVWKQCKYCKNENEIKTLLEIEAYEEAAKKLIENANKRSSFERVCV